MRRSAPVPPLLVVLFFLAIPQQLLAQAGGLRGRVVDASGNPLAGAAILVEGTSLRTTSSERGTYELRGLPAGSWQVRIRLIGYYQSWSRVDVAPGAIVDRDWTLERTPYVLAPVDVTVGSRARHTAADELAVPVDVYTAEDIARQGTRETSQILQALTPSVNFPRQSVTDATDIVRPFTLRGLSPDHTLVLLNGVRRHQTAVVSTFAYGTGAGSSGVDLNAIPASAIERLEVLRDGASAQYGSDAIAGVVNMVVREGPFTPFVNAEAGRYFTGDYGDDGSIVDVNGGAGFSVGRGSLAIFGEVLNRQPTNRAWADPSETCCNGQMDSVDSEGNVVVKRNPVDQPNHHWGDGREKDVMTFANFRMPVNDARTREIYAFGGYSNREGTGNGYRRYGDGDRNWLDIFPLGYLPEFAPDVTDYSAAGGFRAAPGAWSIDIGGAFGHNDFEYNLENTLNVSLGPCLDPADPCAPGDDGILGNGDDPGIPNQTSFFAGRLSREEFTANVTAAREINLGLARPVSLALGAAFRNEHFQIERGETASWIDGGHDNVFGLDAPGGSQVFAGFNPDDETDESRSNVGVYGDLEANLSDKLLANVAARFESYSDFGERLTGKVAIRFAPSQRLTLRAAGSTGFRAPGLGQTHFSKVVTNVIEGVFSDIGVFPVGHPAALLLGSEPLQEETAVNLSAGFAVTPRDNLTITADVYYIAIDDRILLGATFDDDFTQALLDANGFGNIDGVQYFTNGLDTETRGIDLTATWRLPAGPGLLDLTGVMNYTRNEIVRVDPLPEELAGSEETGLLDEVTRVAIEEERPDWRGTLSAWWAVNRFHLLGRMSYFGGFASSQPCFADGCREEYGSKTLFDAEIGYGFDQMNLSVGVRNLFDTYPDQPQLDFNNNFGIFPWAAASPFGYNGRFAYVRTEIPLTW
ncbi:MAG: TonB-dependent receptor [Gemmatimonadales bacterium]